MENERITFLLSYLDRAIEIDVESVTIEAEDLVKAVCNELSKELEISMSFKLEEE